MSDKATIHTDNRQFIRHPSDIPIEYCFTDKAFCVSDVLTDISMGGLSFHSDQYIEPAQWLHLHIPVSEDHFEIDVQVRWCCKDQNAQDYNVGVLFDSEAAAFSARMVEQVCHIEQYKKTMLQQEGRILTGDEAAAEWIEKFATTFPRAADVSYIGNGKIPSKNPEKVVSD